MFVALILFALVLIYTFINIQQAFRVSGATVVWTETILKDICMLNYFEWLPLIVSVLFGIVQFYPEMSNKRLKLTLHLPMSENKILLGLLTYGFCCLASLFVLTIVTLTLGLNVYYPSEIVSYMLLSSLPWFLSGIAAYFLIVWICIEPVWRQRVFNTIIGGIFISYFMLSAKSGAYIYFIPYLILVAIASFLFTYYSMYRFKEGAQ